MNSDIEAIPQILTVLTTAERDLSVNEITKLTGLSRITVHYSMKALKELKKVRVTRKIGRIPLYELVNKDV